MQAGCARACTGRVLRSAHGRRSGAPAFRRCRSGNAAAPCRKRRQGAAEQPPSDRAEPRPWRDRAGLWTGAGRALRAAGDVRRHRCEVSRAPARAAVLPCAHRGCKMIEVTALAKSFVGRLGRARTVVHAVTDVSFKAQDGRITALLGPNGAGKTTTLRVLATLMRADRGTATVGGFDVGSDPVSVRAQLGVLSDARGLYTRITARENIA